MCGSGNPIDDCWRCDFNWESPRQSLADCATGFGKISIGGKNGQIYVVTDDTDYDVINPAPGTLRYGVVKSEPLWIVFARNMMITLQEELVVKSVKTIDGRDHSVHISGGACLTFQYVSNIIIHGVHIHDCKSTGHAVVRGSPTHFGRRGGSDGDGINVFAAHDIWVEHRYFSNCNDSLIDAIHGSTAITISNNYFTNQDKVNFAPKSA
jgi:pectate lyase